MLNPDFAVILRRIRRVCRAVESGGERGNILQGAFNVKLVRTVEITTVPRCSLLRAIAPQVGVAQEEQLVVVVAAHQAAWQTRIRAFNLDHVSVGSVRGA